jgi:hypothetical protein
MLRHPDKAKRILERARADFEKQLKNRRSDEDRLRHEFEKLKKAELRYLKAQMYHAEETLIVSVNQDEGENIQNHIKHIAKKTKEIEAWTFENYVDLNDGT